MTKTNEDCGEPRCEHRWCSNIATDWTINGEAACSKHSGEEEKSNMEFIYIVEAGERNYGGSILEAFAGTKVGLKKAYDKAGAFLEKEENRFSGSQWLAFPETTHVACWTNSCDYIHIRKLKVTS